MVLKCLQKYKAFEIISFKRVFNSSYDMILNYVDGILEKRCILIS